MKKGCWLYDKNFKSKEKERFICSACGWWQTAKKSNATGMLFAMRHCPRCGMGMSYEVRLSHGEGGNSGQ